MKRRFLGAIAVGSLFIGLLAACSISNEGPAKGKAVFVISDAAADMGAVTSIKVTIDSVRVHGQGEVWTTVSTKAQTYDLLELKAKGTAKLIAEAELDAAMYNQMELNISKVVVTDNKGEHEAKLPSNKLQIKGNLDVQAQSTATANFDVLADQSLHVTGTGQFILAPVIRLETKARAQADVRSNSEVTITGGATTTNTTVGADIEGNVGVGLKISPSAVLNIESSGKIVQSKGEVVLTGVVKSVDAAAGTITVTTKGGEDVVLKTGGSVNVRQGAEVVASYDAETKGSASITTVASLEGAISIGGQTSGPTPTRVATTAPATATPGTPAAPVTATPGTPAVQVSATVTGTLKAVDVGRNMVTITTQAGADLALSVASSARVTADGAVATIAALATKIGAAVTAEYSASTNIATSISAQAKASASATATGSLKAVNALANTVTIAVQGSADLVLNITAQTKVTVNGSASTSAALLTMVGKQCTAEYNAETKAVVTLNVQG